MKNKKIIIIIILVICFAAAFYSMSGVLTPYVPFNDAQESGNNVQIIGALNKLKPVTYEEGLFIFEIKDKSGNSMNVLYRGVKPLNFEHADQIVVQGIYDSRKGIFEAEKLFVKCPSKYKKAE